MKNKLSSIFILILSISLFYCNGKESEQNDTFDNSHIATIQNFDSLFTRIKEITVSSDSLFEYSGNGSISFINKDTMLVNDLGFKRLSIIDGNGKWIANFGALGKGPFELTRFSSVGRYKNGFFIYDSYSGKLVIYNKNFNPIKEMINLPLMYYPIYNKDFNSDFYMYSLRSSSILKEAMIYHFDSLGVKLSEFCDPPDYSHLLAVASIGGGGIFYFNRKFYQAFPGKYEINVFDLNTEKLEFSFGKAPKTFYGYADVIKSESDQTNFELINKTTPIIKLSHLKTKNSNLILLQYISRGNEITSFIDLYTLNGDLVKSGITLLNKGVVSVFDNWLLVQNRNTIPYRYEVYEVAF